MKRALPVFLLLMLALTACGSDQKPADDAKSSASSDGDGLVFGVAGKGLHSAARKSDRSALGVNAYLWRATLDVLSFMPLASADPFGGVIITDWFRPPAAPDERFKATATILGRELRADAIRVSIFRQTLQNNAWVDSPISRAVNGELEDKVLARARELREQAGTGN